MTDLTETEIGRLYNAMLKERNSLRHRGQNDPYRKQLLDEADAILVKLDHMRLIHKGQRYSSREYMEQVIRAEKRKP